MVRRFIVIASALERFGVAGRRPCLPSAAQITESHRHRGLWLWKARPTIHWNQQEHGETSTHAIVQCRRSNLAPVLS